MRTQFEEEKNLRIVIKINEILRITQSLKIENKNEK